MVRLFDHHCHLDPATAADQVAAAEAAGVSRLICVGCDQASVGTALALADAHPQAVWAAVGCHPHEARHGWSHLEAALAHPRVVAVGEAGLDYHYDLSPRPAQQASFAAQIELAHRLDLPLIVHTREAWDDTFVILDRESTPRRTVFHCFTGGPDEATACLERGAHLSFSGIASFKNATDVAAAARLCPLDRLMVETDAPYLAPVPHRGKRNQPAWVLDVAKAVANLRSTTLDELADATWVTTNAFYGLAP